MKKRLFVLAVMLLALSMVPFAANAQADTCFNLSPEDCAIISDAAANSQQNITSFVQDFGLTVTGANLEVLAMLLPGAPGSFTLTANGSGPFAFTPDDMTSPIVMDLPMVFDVDGMTMEFPLTIANGFVYFPMGGELVGVPLEAAGEVEAGGVGADDLLGENPANLAELLGMDPAAAAGALNPSGTDTSAYVNYVRLADGDIMGQTAFPFEFTLDITALLNSPEFQQALGMLGGLLGGMGGEGMEEDPTTDMVLQLLPLILSGVESDMAVTQYVGADDNFIHRIEFELNFAIDLGVLMGTGAGAGGDTPQMPPLELGVDFWVELSDINAPVEVAAPEGARELSPEEAEALFDEAGGMLGGALGGGF